MSKINHPIDLLGKFPVDAKNVTFNTLEQALTTITNFKRYRGLIIKIKNGKWITRYWWESDDLSDSGISLLDKYPEITNEPTGFKSDVAVHNEDIDIEYNSTTKSIKIAGSLVGYYKGKDIITIATGSEWISDPCPNVVGEKHYQLRYGDSGWEWVASNAFDYRKLNVAYLYFRSNGDFVFGLRSCDGLMQWQSKENFKKKFGTTLESGGDLTDYIKNSTTPADRRPLISQTVVSDEDVNTINLAKANEIYTQAYISGANATSNPDQADIVPLVAGLPQYNLKTDEVYSLSELPNNKVMSVWVYSKPALKDNQSQKYRYVFQVGQWYSDDVIEERARQTNELYHADLQAIIPRVVYIAQIIIKRLGADWTIEDVVKLSGSQNIQLSISGNYLSIVQTDGTTITGTGTTTDPVKSNVFNADEAGANLPQRSKIQGGEYIEYTDDDVNSKTIIDIKPDKLEEATELESEVIELEQADELETETLLNPDWEETDPTKISYIQNKPTLSGSLWENDEFKMVGYGYLYNWFVTSNIANGNWRVPTWAEATELQTYLLTEYGVNDHEAYLMLAISDSSFWNNTDVRTNNFNFNAIAAGYRFSEFGGINEELRVWTQTEANDTYSRTLVIDRAEPGWPLRLGTYASFKRNGASIKLIRNASTSELLLEDGTYVDDYIGNDGRKYKSIKLGNYVWLSENLCETLYNDLTPIINVTDQTEWDALTTGAYCIYNNDPDLIGLFIGEDTIKPKDDKKVDVKHISGLTNGLWEPETFQKVGYGYLYNGYAVYESVRFNGFIEGFTVPTEAQLYELINIVEGNGNKLKSKRVDPDIHPRWDAGYVATDDFNLSLVPGGGRGDVNYGFSSIGAALQIYSSSGVYNEELFFIGVINDGTIIDGVISDLIYGFSMRCIRQLTNDELLLTDGTFLPTVKDYDGNTYQVVKIGNYGWMAQNLATSHYADGTEIPNVTDQTEWDALEEPAYCIYNNNPALSGLYYTDEVINQNIKPKDKKTVRSEHIEGLDNSKWQLKPIEIRSGYLYNWYALENIANTGWRVPTESDWDALALLIDPNYSKVFGENNYNSLIGRALSLNDRRFWKYMLSETLNEYNVTQFNAVGTGYRDGSTGLFYEKRALTRYHSSTIDGSNQISHYTIEVQGYSISESYDNDRFTFGKWDYRSRGMSVRLCRDATTIELDIPDYSRMVDYVGNDGKSYKTVKIGSLVWMAENLCETIDNIGQFIFYQQTDWENAWYGCRCSYNNDETNSLLFNNFITPKLEKKINQFDIIQQPFEYLTFDTEIYYSFGHGQNRDNTNGSNKKIEADGSFTLYISEFQNGDTGTLRIHNTDSNPITITLTTGFTNKGIGSLSNLASNTHYLLTWVFDGDVFMYRIEQLT